MNFLFKIKHYLIPYFVPSHYSISSAVHPGAGVQDNYWVAGYSQHIDSNKWKFHEGIPLGLYNGDWDGAVVRRTHVCALAEYFFALDSEMDREKKARVVSFIIENLNLGVTKDGATYAYWKTFVSEDDESFFVHGMGQGQLLSVLIRAKHMRLGAEIDFYIKALAESYKLCLSDPHGFVDRSEGVVFQEYPNRLNINDAVLNGWIFSALGLYDLIACGGADSDIKRLFFETVETLRRRLRDYDIGFWTLYNAPQSWKNIASAHYHGLHIVLVECLGTLLCDQEMTAFSRRMSRRSSNVFVRCCALIVKLMANVLKYGRIYKTG